MEQHEPMERLIKLLDRKNLCFRSFHDACSGFLDEISRGDTSNLERFQRRRQGLLGVLERLESEIAALLGGYGSQPRLLESMMTSETRTRINRLFREKDSMVKSILDLDLQVLHHIDRIKSETIHKLQSLQAGRRSLGAYRSPMERIEDALGPKIVDEKA